jgi:acyl carrier protein
MKEKIMTDPVHRVFAETLNVPVEDITEDTAPENTAAWDSLKAMDLVSAIEEAFSVELTTAEIMAMRSVGRARAVLQKKGVALT